MKKPRGKKLIKLQEKQGESYGVFESMLNELHAYYSKVDKAMSHLLMAACWGVYDEVGGPIQMFNRWEKLVRLYPLKWKKAKKIVRQIAKMTNTKTLKKCREEGLLSDEEI